MLLFGRSIFLAIVSAHRPKRVEDEPEHVSIPPILWHRLGQLWNLSCRISFHIAPLGQVPRTLVSGSDQMVGILSGRR